MDSPLGSLFDGAFEELYGEPVVSPFDEDPHSNPREECNEQLPNPSPTAIITITPPPNQVIPDTVSQVRDEPRSRAQATPVPRRRRNQAVQDASPETRDEPPSQEKDKPAPQDRRNVAAWCGQPKLQITIDDYSDAHPELGHLEVGSFYLSRDERTGMMEPQWIFPDGEKRQWLKHPGFGPKYQHGYEYTSLPDNYEAAPLERSRECQERPSKRRKIGEGKKKERKQVKAKAELLPSIPEEQLELNAERADTQHEDPRPEDQAITTAVMPLDGLAQTRYEYPPVDERASEPLIEPLVEHAQGHHPDPMAGEQREAASDETDGSIGAQEDAYGEADKVPEDFMAKSEPNLLECDLSLTKIQSKSGNPKWH